jgi:PAS domain S-box-containing protein
VGAVSRRRGSILAPELLVYTHPLDGRVVGTFAVLSRNENALRRNQEELRQVIDAIPQLIVAMSPAGQILYANESVLESTGLSLCEVMADGFREWLFHPDDLEKLRSDRSERMKRGVPFELEMRLDEVFYGHRRIHVCPSVPDQRHDRLDQRGTDRAAHGKGGGAVS